MEFITTKEEIKKSLRHQQEAMNYAQAVAEQNKALQEKLQRRKCSS